jgi:hypothetical protein
MHAQNELLIDLFKKHLGSFEALAKEDVWHQRLFGWVMFWMWVYEEDENRSFADGVLKMALPTLLVGLAFGSILGTYEGFLFDHTLWGLVTGSAIGGGLAAAVGILQLAKGRRSIKLRYMTDFITFMGLGLYAPDIGRLEHYSFWRVLAHEFVHGHDDARLPPLLFKLGYAMPQGLALLALLAIGKIWFPWMVWFGLCQAFLLPLPSPVRAWAELRGYTMSMATRHWDGKENSEEYIENIAENFYGPDYFFMWPFKSDIRKRLAHQLESIHDDSILEDEVFRIVREATKKG